jgi:hypothetical protein
MKRYWWIPIFLSLLLVGANSCRPFMEKSVLLWLKDESGRGFDFLVSRQYPDTTIPDDFGRIIRVQPNEKRYCEFRGGSFDYVFKQLPADTLTIFIFSSDTIATKNWQEIRSGYKILRRYDLSQADIERLDNTITYP